MRCLLLFTRPIVRILTGRVVVVKKPYRSISKSATMTNDLEFYYNFVLDRTKEAGKLVKEKFNANKNVLTKTTDIDLVTETDQEVERYLICELKHQFPRHKFIGEESVAGGSQCKLTNAPTWVIDPIDGTMNFVHSFPHSCISIALFVDAIPVIGIIYNPILEQLFTARKGQGAYYNGKRIKVSGETDMSKALIMMENGVSRDTDRLKTLFENQKMLIPQVHGIRSLGSAALNMAMVALGAADVYFEYGIHIWDIAAGEVIATEAGGVVIDPAGGPIDRMSRRVLCASSAALAEQLSQKLIQFYPNPRD